MKKVLLSVIIPSLALVPCVKQEEVNQNNQQDKMKDILIREDAMPPNRL